MEALAPVFAFLSSAAGPLSAVGSAIGIGKELFGGGGGGGGSTSGPSSTPATVTPSTSPTTPAVTPVDYTKQQNAYYQQMLSGLGMGTPGGELPPGLQEAINRQASML